MGPKESQECIFVFTLVIPFWHNGIQDFVNVC